MSPSTVIGQYKVSWGQFCPKMYLSGHIAYIIMSDCVAGFNNGIVIARHVPGVNLLCLTKEIYYVVKKYETNEPQLTIAIG